MPKKVSATIAAVALVLGLLASVGPGIDAVKDAAGWFGEHPVALLGFALFTAGIPAFAIGRRSSSWRMHPGHVEADKKTFAELVETVPRATVDFLEEHDFGASWPDGMTEPVYRYVAERKAVDDHFHDSEAERRRVRFYIACEKFTHTLAGYSVPSDNSRFFEMNEKSYVRNHPPGDETYTRYETHRRELNELAGAVVEAYDQLVVTARRRLPGA